MVIFRDNADKANQVVPLSSFDSDNPENLWKALEAYESKTGGRVLAIPHNGNLSNGRMVQLADFAGNPLGLCPLGSGGGQFPQVTGLT